MTEYFLSGYFFAIGLCVVAVVALFFLLRGRRIREKYVGLWLAVAVVVIVFGAFPGLAIWLARVVGVHTPVNLLFSGALVVLLVVCIQLSVAISALEERSRTLTEEVALLRYDLDAIQEGRSTRNGAIEAETGADVPSIAREEG